MSENSHKQNDEFYFCAMLRIKILIVFVLIILFACNTSTDNNPLGKKTSAENPYPKNIQLLFAQTKQYPDSTALHFQLATALDSIGEYEQALQQLNSLIKKDTANFGLWFKKGQIAEDAKDTFQAMESYDRALRIYPSADAMLSLANLYAEQKNKNALLICNRVNQLSLGREYDAHSAFISGIYYARTKNKTRALQYFDECIANNYTYMEAYIEKGLVYLDNGEYNEALKVFRFASAVNALNAEPYYWMGRCYEMLNIKDSAILRFKQSFRLDKNASETKEALKRLGAAVRN